MIAARSFPLIMILLLFIGSFLILFIKEKDAVKKLSLFNSNIVFLLSVFTLFYVLRNGEYVYKIGHWDAPWGVVLKVGVIEAVLGVTFAFVANLVIWYSIYGIEKELQMHRIPFYYLLLQILTGALLGIVFSDDLFNCFVFIEISTLASCGIIVAKDKKENIRAAFRYLVLSCLGSGLVLMGIAFLYTITGHLNMTFAHQEVIRIYQEYDQILLIVLVLFTVGLGVKSAMYPLHIWLPDAHSNAPSASSAILSSLVLKAFVVLLMKVLFRVFGFEIIARFPILDFILILGIIGMIAGSVAAILQKEIKKIIAYSSVAQMGYIFFGIGLGNAYGLTIAIFHIIAHAVTKSALFLTAGAMIEKTGRKELDAFRGIGKEMPITFALFTLAALSMIGIPVLPGFVSKWYFALASIEAGKMWLIAVLLLSSLLNAVYYLPIVINGYFGEENLQGKVYGSKMKPIREIMPVVFLITGMVLIGVYSRNIIRFIGSGVV